MPEKTRGSIIINISSVLDRFRHGRLKRAFCEKTTLVPELSFHGAVIVLAMPTLTWNEDGVIAQHLFKYLWQRSVLTRNSLAKEHRERPLFLYSDEAQETASSYDGEFLGLCRGSKCCVMYMSQSLPTYIAKMGGDNPRDAAYGLLGKFTTHVFNSNACPETNEFASRTIGKMVKRRANYSSGESRNVNYGMNVGSGTNQGTSSNSGWSSSYSNSSSNRGHNSGSGNSSGTSDNWGSNRGRGYGDSVSRGYSEVLENAIEPGEFARTLRTGGKHNGNEVTGVWFQGGRIFNSTGLNMLLATFRQ